MLRQRKKFYNNGPESNSFNPTILNLHGKNFAVTKHSSLLSPFDSGFITMASNSYIKKQYVKLSKDKQFSLLSPFDNGFITTATNRYVKKQPEKL